MKTIESIEFYSILEVAERLKVSVPTVRKYIKDGKLKSRRIGKNILITTEDIKNFIEIA